jgi:hypothetical protein
MPEQRDFANEIDAFLEGAPLPEIEEAHIKVLLDDPERTNKLLAALKEERQWVAYWMKTANTARAKLEGIAVIKGMERPMIYQDGPLSGVFDAMAPKVGAGMQARTNPHAE